jgi:hypothetical protein
MIIDRDTPEPIHFLRHNVYIGYYTIPKPIQPDEKYNTTIYAATKNQIIFRGEAIQTKSRST